MVQNPQRGWEVPGGQVEMGESLGQALVRETQEESGITSRIGPLAGIYPRLNPPHNLILTFLGEYVTGEPVPSPESLKSEWVARDKVLRCVSHPIIRDRVADLLNFQGQVRYRLFSTKPYTIHEDPFFSNFYE